MIISTSGHIGSGKDTIAKIIQFLTLPNEFSKTTRDILADKECNWYCANKSNWQIKKFADTLKDIVCLLIGCTREQLEDQSFKDTELGEEWWKISFIGKSQKREYYPYLDKDLYNYNFSYSETIIIRTTPRLLLQLLGTDCGRDIIHPNLWVNSLMNEYKPLNEKVFNTYLNNNGTISKKEELIYPSWCITDMRFENELEAVKAKQGITIRVNSPEFYYLNTITNEVEKSRRGIMNKIDYPHLTPLENTDRRVLNSKYFHISETALDKHEFDYYIMNNEGIEDLIEKVKIILKKEKII